MDQHRDEHQHIEEVWTTTHFLDLIEGTEDTTTGRRTGKTIITTINIEEDRRLEDFK